MTNEEYYEFIENASKKVINALRFNDKLRLARAQSGLTQKQVADELGIPYQDYQRYEYGLHFPTISRTRKLAIILNANANDLITSNAEERFSRMQNRR